MVPSIAAVAGGGVRITITFEKVAAGTRITDDANLALRGLRYLADFALHLAFQRVGSRALEGMRVALEERARR